ncbi:hyaluronidase B-like [Oratosquilla oratoria]|uniref:hyaluronidase B-like n=1 Tax=Oratosquilla oratoria TaxID=337810 RepID=UPI003F75D268
MHSALVCITAIVWLLCRPSNGAVPSPFPVYWNVPTEQCLKYNITIDVTKFGITQNTNDDFYGDKVTIFYNAGKFPVITNDNRVINGGIPQRGNITLHATTFYEKVIQQMPSNFSGVAILDFENYFPSYDISSAVYRSASKQWVKEIHPNWTSAEIEAFAETSFNESAQLFFQLPLMMGRALRPGALWGYYHYPYCEGQSPTYVFCRPTVMDANNQMLWLYESSSALFPSIYIFEKGWTPRTRRLVVKGRLLEAMRVRGRMSKDVPIMPYFWFRYHDEDTYLIGIDLVNTLGQTRLLKLEGAVIWGGTSDVANKEKCLQFQEYINSTLGPLVLFVQELPIREVRRALNSKRYAQRLIDLALAKEKEKKLFSNIVY